MSDPSVPGSPSAGPGPDEPDASGGPSPGADAPPNTPWSAPLTGWQPPAQGSSPAPPVAAPPVYGPPAAPPARHRRFALIVLCAGFLALGVLLGIGVSHGFWPSRSVTVTLPGGVGSNGLPFGNGGSGGLPFGGSGGSASGGSSSSASGGPSNVNAIAGKVAPALVDINLGEIAPGATAAATGIVLTPSGLVLTNNHVVDQATTVKATDLGNGRTYSATVVGYDATLDVALLQLHGASGLKTATLGDSAKVTVGQPVVGIGNAGGLGGTPSAAGGKVTALDRQITVRSDSGFAQRLSGLIETNAAIQRGDSGGPLVDSSGRVIGVNTAASSALSSGGMSGRGFAIPIDAAMSVVTQIEKNESSPTVHIGPTAFLGVELAGPAARTVSGATLLGVLSGSPAARAGLKAGDTIVSVDGQSVGSSQALTKLMGSHRPGDSVTIGWKSPAGVRHIATVRLASGPAH